MRIYTIFTTITSIIAITLFVGSVNKTELIPQIVLPATIIDIHDGDTVKVRIEQTVSIRLLQTWSAELSQPGGKEALENLQKICPIGSKVLLQVPFETDTSKMFTFGRVLGNVYKDGINVGERQIQDGFATKNKPKKTKG